MSGTKKTTDKPKTVDDVVTSYLAEAQSSLKDYADLAANAGKRISSSTKDDPKSSWSDDVVTFWALVARDQAAYANAVNQWISVVRGPKDDE